MTRPPRPRSPRLEVLLALALAGAPAAAAPLPWSPAELEVLARDLEAVVSEHQVPGAAVALVTAEHPAWIRCFGHADRDRGTPLTSDSLFRVASVSKTFTSLALMRLVEEGELGLDDPLARVAPEVRLVNPWSQQAPVRLAHLLEHTSGLRDFHFDEILGEAPSGEGGVGIRSLLEVGHQPFLLRWPPGSRFAYSNRGYAVAGYLVERARGRPFDQVMEQEVFGPLKMSTSFRTSRLEHGLAQGYLAPDAGPAPVLTAFLRPAANAAASVRDLARWTRMLLGGGQLEGARVLGQAWVERMGSPRTSPAARAGLGLGYGVGLNRRVNRSLPTLGLYGGGYAYQSAFAYLPGQGRGYVVMINSSYQRDAFNRLQERLYREMVRDLVVPEPPRVRAEPEELERFAGWYQVEGTRHAVLEFLELPLRLVQLIPSGEHLLLRPLFLGRERRLVPCGGERFRLEEESDVSMVLRRRGPGWELVGAEMAYRSVGAATLALTATLLLAILVALLTPLGWLGRRLVSGSPAGRPLALASLSSLVLVGVPLLATRLPVHLLGQVTPVTLLVYLGSAGYALLAPAIWVAGLAGWLARRTPAGGRPLAWLLPATAHLILAVWLASHGLLGLRLWAD